jgi:hypothetical protein
LFRGLPRAFVPLRPPRTLFTDFTLFHWRATGAARAADLTPWAAFMTCRVGRPAFPYIIVVDMADATKRYGCASGRRMKEKADGTGVRSHHYLCTARRFRKQNHGGRFGYAGMPFSYVLVYAGLRFFGWRNGLAAGSARVSRPAFTAKFTLIQW